MVLAISSLVILFTVPMYSNDEKNQNKKSGALWDRWGNLGQFGLMIWGILGQS